MHPWPLTRGKDPTNTMHACPTWHYLFYCFARRPKRQEGRSKTIPGIRDGGVCCQGRQSTGLSETYQASRRPRNSTPPSAPGEYMEGLIGDNKAWRKMAWDRGVMIGSVGSESGTDDVASGLTPSSIAVLRFRVLCLLVHVPPRPRLLVIRPLLSPPHQAPSPPVDSNKQHKTALSQAPNGLSLTAVVDLFMYLCPLPSYELLAACLARKEGPPLIAWVLSSWHESFLDGEGESKATLFPSLSPWNPSTTNNPDVPKSPRSDGVGIASDGWEPLLLIEKATTSPDRVALILPSTVGCN
ncbi:hypothetical protein EDB81DRAFT_769279 [Dactylonectria macrodidyma]|uniref:Uncharacterized protein n=1 Tax=Dactylonectria macrodidyma TaxID=307937 RepID=A0A9P9CXS2_9HYPO|nr:hypothetical protein EDB81DRAFT_769279 [Dactylonectria macrodidyma]